MNWKLIIVGAVAILAFGATYVFLRAPNPAPPPVAETQPKVEVEQVLVAAKDLPMGSVVDEGDRLANMAKSRRLRIDDHEIGQTRRAQGRGGLDDAGGFPPRRADAE